MRRAGYTYVEMLVVITVIGILVALLLPAVQAAREAARRSQCAQNIVQLLVALQNYEIHHDVFPPGTVDAKGPILSQPVGYHHNWIVQILPFLEQRNASRHVDSGVSVYDVKNVPVRQLSLTVLRCPSLPLIAIGYSDYAGMQSDTETPIDVDNNGVFFLNSRIQYDHLWDGSSQTIFLGEKWTVKGDLGWMSGTRATLRNAGTPINTIGRLAQPARIGPIAWNLLPKEPPLGLFDDRRGDAPIPDGELVSVLLGPADLLAPAGEFKAQQRTIIRPTDSRLAVGGFSSMHPGGAQFGFGDGSVQFFTSTINPATFQKLAHRADGSLMTTDY